MHTDGSRLLFFILLLVLGSGSAWSQNLVVAPWQSSFSPANTYDLDQRSLQALFSKTTSRWERRETDPAILLSLPQPDGSNSTYQIWRSEQMAPLLAASFPNIQTYFGQAMDNSRHNVYLIQTARGVKVLYFDESGMICRLEPVHANLPMYQFSMRSDWGILPDLGKACQATADEEDMRWQEDIPGQDRRGETKFFRYRLALACTGEYGSFHGTTKEDVLAAMNELLLQVNAIYEREMSIHFDLVAHNDKLIFLDAATDPYDNFDVENLLESNKMVCNYAIGYPNFDVGHVLATTFGGQAHIGSVCNFSRKAKAFSGLESPEGYYMGAILAHELGHQIGAQHTQSNDCNRNQGTALEPGSGSTIMAYAGICAPNVQSLPDDYFHGNSIELIAKKANLGIIFGCVPGQKTDNLPPVANAGKDLYIPIGTPFQLQGSGSDPNGDSLSYLWEQMDVLSAIDSNNLYGPAFRSLPPSALPTRTIGDKDEVWEKLPDHARSATFRLTVRDHHFGLGTTAYDEMTVHFIDAAGPLTVLSPNKASVRWKVGSSRVIEWDEAGTSQSPLFCDTVSIYLSADGGENYNIPLAEKIPNSGSALIEVPYLTGTHFRVKVGCANGNFFDVSDHNFEIFDPNIPAPMDTISTDTTTVIPIDSITGVIDTTLTAEVDTTITLEPDTLTVPIVDTTMVALPDTTQNPAIDTLGIPELDTIWVAPPDDPLPDLPTDMPTDTTVNAPIDTIVNIPVDTIVHSPADTLVNLEPDTIPNFEDSTTENAIDTLPGGTTAPLGNPPDLLSSTGCKVCYPNITLAPNPSIGSFYLRLDLPNPEPGQFYLLNGQGKVLQHRSLHLEAGAQDLEWDISTFPNGIYWVRIVVGGQQWVKAVILAR